MKQLVVLRQASEIKWHMRRHIQHENIEGNIQRNK